MRIKYLNVLELYLPDFFLVFLGYQIDSIGFYHATHVSFVT